MKPLAQPTHSDIWWPVVNGKIANEPLGVDIYPDHAEVWKFGFECPGQTSKTATWIECLPPEIDE